MRIFTNQVVAQLIIALTLVVTFIPHSVMAADDHPEWPNATSISVPSTTSSTSEIYVTIHAMDDDNGNAIEPEIAPGLIEVVSTQTILPTLVIAWERTFGGDGGDFSRSVQQTADSGYIIAGGTSTHGAGGYDAYLIKTDAMGNEQWSRTFGGLKEDTAESVQQTSDGGYIIAGRTVSYATEGSKSNVYLVKTDTKGNEQWHSTFGGAEFVWAESVQQTADGGYIIAGTTGVYGAGGIYLVKTDAKGNEEWQKTFGGSGSEWGNSVQQTSDGGYIIAGMTSTHGAGGYDAYLIKMDAMGNEQWSRTFGGSNEDTARSVQQTSDGGYIIAGRTVSYATEGPGGDVYLVKTDTKGNEQWHSTFGGSKDDNAYSVEQTADGGFIIAGYTMSYGAGGWDFYLVKTDAKGNEQWNKTFGGTGRDKAESIQPTSDGGYIIAGWTDSSGAGTADIYLIKLEESSSSPPSTTPDSDAGIPSQNIISSADSYRLMLDSSVEVVNTANIRGALYYIVAYTNALPFASGIEVLSEDGSLVSDTSIIRSVFSSIGWQEAAGYITASDISTLEEVLKISGKIDGMISPVRKATNVVIGAVDNLDEMAIDIPLLGRKSAWDAVVASYPDIKYLEKTLRSLDESLNEWGDASQSLSQSIPTAIQGLQEIQAGGELNPDLQREIGKSVTGMASLEDITNQSIAILSDTASVISSAASGLERASDTKYVGKFISPVASKVSGLYDDIIDLKSAAQTFSTDLSRQQAKLKKVTDAAEAKEDELYAAWTSRQGAAAKVYGVIFGGAGLVMILGIIIILLWLRRRRLAKQPISPTEPEEVSAAMPIDTTPTVMAPEKPQMSPAAPVPVPPPDSIPAPEPTELDTTSQYTLMLKVNGEGTIVPAEGMHQFVEGTVVYVNAIASERWQFIGWVGDVDEPYTQGTTITMDMDKTVTATFQPSQ